MPSPSSVPAFQRQRPRHEPSAARSLLIAVVAMVVALIPVIAAASPPDPTWIGGIYDAADGDDLVALIGEQAGSHGVAGDAISRPSPRTQAVLQLEPCTGQRLPKRPLTRGPPPGPCTSVASPALLRVHPRPPAVHSSSADCPTEGRNA